MKTKVLLSVMALALIAGCLCAAWRNRATGTEETAAAYKAVVETVDKRLPDITPKRYEETKERTVKTYEKVHAEAKALSRDHLCDALNSELALWKRYYGCSYRKW